MRRNKNEEEIIHLKSQINGLERINNYLRGEGAAYKELLTQIIQNLKEEAEKRKTK